MSNNFLGDYPHSPVRDFGRHRKSPGGGQPGVRDTGHKVGIGRMGFCQCRPGAEPGFVDGDSVNLAVQTGKINVFKYAVCLCLFA